MDISERDVGGRRTAARIRKMALLTGMLLLVAVVAIIIFICLATRAIPLGPGSDAEETERENTVSITVEEAGVTDDSTPVHKYTMKNKGGMEVQFLTLGGTITDIHVPDRNGKLADVSLGYDSFEKYKENGPYFGVLVGRYANRIANGTFSIDGTEYKVTINNGPNSLHGGQVGWNKAVWKHEKEDDHVILTHTSPDGDQGYPGKVKATVTYTLTDDNELKIKFTATSRNKPTPINLTSHPYFNLAGQGTGTIYTHKISIFADHYLPVTDSLIPTGVADVSDTLFDLRDGVVLGDRVNNITGGGYDHNFCVRGPTGTKLVARVEHAASGRVLEVFTNQPGVQFYTGNFLLGEVGKGEQEYVKHGGFCLEPQNYPDSPNQPSFPDSILRPGSTYIHEMAYKFSTK